MISSQQQCLYVLHERLDINVDVPVSITKNASIRLLTNKEQAALFSKVGEDGLSYHFRGWQRIGGNYIVEPNVKDENPIYGLDIGPEENTQAILVAFMISQKRLLPSLSIEESSIGWAPDHLHNIYQYNRNYNQEKKCLSEENIEHIKAIHSNLDKHGDNLYAPIGYYENSLSVPFGSEFWVIALCSILERALVNKKERYLADAISKKASFLQNFYGDQTHSDFTKGNNQEIWKKLYDWRSKFVHGGYADFSKNGEFKCLKSLENAKLLLDSGVREILRILATDNEKWASFKEI